MDMTAFISVGIRRSSSDARDSIFKNFDISIADTTNQNRKKLDFDHPAHWTAM